MSTVSGHIDADPDVVFAVLSEGWFYSNWVVGTSHVRAVEAAWPTIGRKLYHASRVWPVVARDETLVENPTLGGCSSCSPGVGRWARLGFGSSLRRVEREPW